MRERRSALLLSQEDEMQILARIVDAICAVPADLSDAPAEQWSQTVIDSCRRQKRRSAVYAAPASPC